MKQIFKLFLFFIITIPIIAQYKPGDERGNSGKRAKAQLEGNRIRTTIHNFGFTGRTGGEFPISEQTPYEWPKNTGQVYLALTAVFIGAEVTDESGNLLKIVDVPTYRNSPEGTSWNLEPVSGYYNDQRAVRSIATSVDRTTWPESWPDRKNDELNPGWAGSWNGLGGIDDFRADQEIFYRMSDDLYARYTNYYPDSTDRSRKGLGILTDVRALAWSQFLVQDAVYVLHTMKNDGTEDIPKTAFLAWHADFVGGNGDSQDDVSEFDLLVDIGFSRDRDNRATEFGSDPVGIIGQAFLETPGNSIDRLDNDNDGENTLSDGTPLGPIVPEEFLIGEIPDDLIDNNGNGLIDESQTHIQFQDQLGVNFADGMDQDMDGEAGSPIVTQEMINTSSSDAPFHRWPANPQNDAIQNGVVHLLNVIDETLGLPFKDNIDNNDNGEPGSPVITQAMIDAASSDAPYFRYKVPETGTIVYNVIQSNLGKKYADGIDNNDNGAVDEFIDENIDEMIDEQRDNGIDEDGDWNALTDDVGLDGVDNTGDEGEGDGVPTSGARFGLPGEPNIDVTDVSETDQIGITNAQYEAAGSWDFNGVDDRIIWSRLMQPGKFYNPLSVQPGEYDLFISSGVFPLKSGKSEPFSVAVILANGPSIDPEGAIRKASIIDKKVKVQETYDNDYQFANAPLPPTVKAIEGDNRVTLYWDDVAESSSDEFIAKITGQDNFYDFEGYKIYRAKDPAFLDAEVITDGFGVNTFKTPIAQFDLVDGIYGFDSVSTYGSSYGINGVKYYLGDETGLQHTFIDSNVQNGFTYYYAVVAYDFGYPPEQILPTESPIRISLQADGSVVLGPNVVQVKPEAPVAGYVPSTLGTVDLVEGTTTGKITYEIIDEELIRDGHVYHITFEDTLKVRSKATLPDTLTTKNFSVFDSTSNTYLIDKSTNFETDYEQPIIDGFRVILENEDRVQINNSDSKWNNNDIQPFIFEKLVTSAGDEGEQRPNDYQLIFGEMGIDTSKQITLQGNVFASKPVNFRVFNVSTQSFINFGFVEIETTLGETGALSAIGAKRDRIVFLEPSTDGSGSEVFTWWFYLTGDTTGTRIPTTGDSAYVFLRKPFLSTDKFRFVAQAAKVDKDLAESDLDKIKVVPNPYIAYASWEQKNPFNTGRGPRELHFNHLPAECTIRIFTINGELVNTIEHSSNLNDGTAVWNMLTKDNLGISYGVYIYHVQAPGIGEKTGKFAVIK